MIKNILLAFLVILSSVGLTIGIQHYFKSDRGAFLILEQGKPVSNFTFEGKQLYDFKGKTIIIHFWATWCPPCLVEFPELIRLAHKRDDVVILAFSSDRNTKAIDRFLSKNTIAIPDNFKIIHDPKATITRDQFSVFRLPESFILRPDMILTDHIVGAYKNWPDL